MTALSRNGYETLDMTMRQYRRKVAVSFDAAENLLWSRYSHVQAVQRHKVQELVRQAALIPWEVALAPINARNEDWKEDMRSTNGMSTAYYNVHVYAGQSIGRRLPQ